MLSWIAEKLVKIGGGQLTVAAVKEFLYKVDKDDDSFPGKQYGERRGRKCPSTHPFFVHMNAASPPLQLPTPLMPQA